MEDGICTTACLVVADNAVPATAVNVLNATRKPLMRIANRITTNFSRRLALPNIFADIQVTYIHARAEYLTRASCFQIQDIGKILRDVHEENSWNTPQQDEALQSLWTISSESRGVESLLNAYPESAIAVLTKVLREERVQNRILLPRIRLLAIRILQRMGAYIRFPKVYATFISEGVGTALLSIICSKESNANPRALFNPLQTKAAMLMVDILLTSEREPKFYFGLDKLQESDSDERLDAAGRKQIPLTMTRQEKRQLAENLEKEAQAEEMKLEQEERLIQAKSLLKLQNDRGYDQKNKLFEERYAQILVSIQFVADKCSDILSRELCRNVELERVTVESLTAVEEALDSLRSLSRSEQLLEKLQGKNLLPLLADVLDKYGVNDEIYWRALALLYSLLLKFEHLEEVKEFFDSEKDETRSLKKVKGRIKEITAWADHEDRGVSFPVMYFSELASGVIAQNEIVPKSQNKPEPESMTKALEKQEAESQQHQNPVRTCGKHIMASYSHKQMDKVKEVVKALQDLGLLVWRDEEGTKFCPAMSGETVEKMATAVEQSYCVLCFVSRDYCKSLNCLREVTCLCQSV